MKTFLKFSGIIAAIVGAVAAVLLVVGNCLSLTASVTALGITTTTVTSYGSTIALFGSGSTTTVITVAGTTTTGNPISFDGHVSAVALIGWILILVAVVALLLAFILAFFKVKAVDKFAGLINLCAAACLVAGGIMVLSSMPSIINDSLGLTTDSNEGFAFSWNWVMAAILAFAAAVLALFPTCADFASKGKTSKKRK